LSARHRRRLAELFDIWEIRNGARARELNRPAATYVATREGIGIGGSDDHAGVDIGRTYSEAPPAHTPQDFLAHVRAGNVLARGAQGSAAKWAHAAIALAARSFGRDRPDGPRERPDPRRVMTMASRLLREGDARHGTVGSDVRPDDARCLLRAWLSAVELDRLDTSTGTLHEGGPSLRENPPYGRTGRQAGERQLIAYMQEDDFSHADLYRRACRLHERKLRGAVAEAVAAASGQADVLAAAEGLFEACIAAIPYAPATAFLASEQAKLAAIPYAATGALGQRAGEPRREDGERPRVAILADGIGSTHGVTRTIEEIRQRGVPGFEIDVVGTDPQVDRRLSAVAEIDVPFYPGLRIGVPSLPAAVQMLAGVNGGGYDVIHVCSPGPAGIAGALVARALGLPLVGSYHTELTAYAGLRSGERRLADAMALAVSSFYRACDVVLSPSPASDAALAAIGMPSERVLRWDRGVDTSRFDPALRQESWLPSQDSPLRGPVSPLPNPESRPSGPINILYSGRITREKGAELLADAFLLAHAREPRLHLVLAGGGPEQEYLRERLGEHASFLGWLEGEQLARTYASADVFLFPSATDTFGQVILEAQASGVPVIAVAEGGPLSLVEDRVSGLLCEADAERLAEAVLELAGSPLLCRHLARGALRAARLRTWERTLQRLADGYHRALAVGHDAERLSIGASDRAA
jgi:glycosyltransferase involved in cell wall biosynthesis